MEENIRSFLKVLDPKDNSTGGGTASAVAGAMASSLVAMVARLSKGKEGLAPDKLYDETIKVAESLAEQLFNGAREDSQAFEAVSRAFKMPKKTDEEKAARKKAIQDGWVAAARLPLANAERCGLLLKLGERLTRSFNQNAKSDLDSAMYLVVAALLGCLANVEINVKSIKDKKIADDLLNQANALRKLMEGK